MYGEARALGHPPAKALQITAAALGRAADAASFLRADGHDGRLRLLIRGELATVIEKPNLIDHAPLLPGVSIEAAEARDEYTTAPDPGAFDRRWAIVVQEQALRTLQQIFSEEGREAIWNQLKPYLARRASAPLATTGPESVDLASIDQLRERYRQEVRRQVAETVTTPLALDSELNELFGPT